MTGKLVLLGLLLVCVAADAADSGYPRKASCDDFGQICPLIYTPVCASDGHTYPNECVMCLERQNVDVLIEKDESCSTPQPEV